MPTSRKVGIVEAAQILDMEPRAVVLLVSEKKIRPVRTTKASGLTFREKELWNYLARRRLADEKSLATRVRLLESKVRDLSQQVSDLTTALDRDVRVGSHRSQYRPMEVRPERVRLLLNRFHPNLFA